MQPGEAANQGCGSHISAVEEELKETNRGRGEVWVARSPVSKLFTPPTSTSLALCNACLPGNAFCLLNLFEKEQIAKITAASGFYWRCLNVCVQAVG